MDGVMAFWGAVVGYGLAALWVMIHQWRRIPEHWITLPEWLVAAGLLGQGVLLVSRLQMGRGAVVMDLAFSLELVVLIAAMLCLIGWRIRRGEMRTVTLILLPLMCALLLISHWLPEGHGRPRLIDPVFAVHLFLSLLAHGMFSIAVILGVFDLIQERALRRKHFGRIVSLLPALGAVEEILFALVRAGFFLLTLSILTGAFYSQREHGAYFLFKHKVVFTWATWFIFGVLLVGRARYGWRGSRAVRLVFAGYITLMLGFLGVKVVTEFILTH